MIVNEKAIVATSDEIADLHLSDYQKWMFQLALLMAGYELVIEPEREGQVTKSVEKFQEQQAQTPLQAAV